jgi:hypothetical protein
LINSLVQGNGFDSLDFQITVNGSLKFDFNSLNAPYGDPVSFAQKYFNDELLNLGTIVPDSGTLDIGFTYDLTESGISDGFGIEAIVGMTTPEPSTIVLVGIAGVLLAARWLARNDARQRFARLSSRISGRFPSVAQISLT